MLLQSPLLPCVGAPEPEGRTNDEKGASWSSASRRNAAGLVAATIAAGLAAAMCAAGPLKERLGYALLLLSLGHLEPPLDPTLIACPLGTLH